MLSSRTLGLLIQIREAILQLKEWNKGVNSSDDYSESESEEHSGTPLVASYFKTSVVACY
jgi:hypothetical protein